MKRIGLSLLLCAAAALAGLMPNPQTQAHAQAMHDMHAPASADVMPVATTSVQIRDFAFSPAAIVVAAGSTITWTNTDDEPHTVAATDRSYRSTPLNTQQSYTRTYAASGEYHYYCSLHPQMTGVVVVRQAMQHGR